MIICKTPFRISFFGGGTDFPEYYKKFGGSVIGSTIDKYSYIILRDHPKYFEKKHRLVWSLNEDFDKIIKGNEIVDLFSDLFSDLIYYNDEFNVVNDQMEFTQDVINYFTDEQISLQDNEFIPVTEIFDLDDLKYEFQLFRKF